MNSKLPLALSAALVGGVFCAIAAQTAPAPAADSASAPAAAPAAGSASARAARGGRPPAGPQTIGGIQAVPTSSSYKFFFGTGDAPAGYTKVTADMAYNDKRGYGFDGGTKADVVSKKAGGKDVNIATTDKSFYFSTALP